MSDFIWLPCLASGCVADAHLERTRLAGGFYRFRSAVAYSEDMSALLALSTHTV
jgi:hypothetical protein